MFQYEIEGRKFVQRKLVWGQLQQLMDLLEGFEIEGEANVADLLKALGDKIPNAAAIVVIEEGQPLKQKDVAALSDFFEENLPVDLSIQMVEDFFVCNPTDLLLRKFANLIGVFQNTMTPTGRNSSSESESSLAEETSPEETT